MKRRLSLDLIRPRPRVEDDASTNTSNKSSPVWSSCRRDSDPSPPAKLHRRGTRRWLSALKSISNNGRSRNLSDKSVIAHPSLESLSPTDSRSRSIFKQGVSKMSQAFFRVPMVEPTVIHRRVSQGRPSLEALAFIPRESSSNSPGSSSKTTNTESSKYTDINSGNSKSPDDSTTKTSLDSKFQLSSSSNKHNTTNTNTNSSDKRHHHAMAHNILTSTGLRKAQNPRLSPDSNLTTIQETAPLYSVQPGVETVERVAAAKIYLETYFDEKLGRGPSPRSLRMQQLKADLYATSGGLENMSEDEQDMIWTQFFRRETEHLRETRVMTSRTIRALNAPRGSPQGCLVDDYDVVKILGKGSFGVVRLVRERPRCQGQFDDMYNGGDGWSDGEEKQVYAMKVIRKSTMLRTSQEGHLRAERDFLVASEGSKWIVPLIASFQDASNLYLVMEYMPGGDFLGLLIRENTLHETVARFYIAEMIICVEATHALQCIHRDIKPDNFLISSSGHLKISDFGLAFDGHWGHDTAYFNSHRYSLVHKLGLHIEGDEQDRNEGRNLQTHLKWTSNIMTSIKKHEKRNLYDGEPLLNWRNRCGNRSSAMSVVGTSQYMAPEWSIGVILYECLYGHTPFLSEEGRHMTKQNILRHKDTFAFPNRPAVSSRCRHLIENLIQDKEHRICSKRYQIKDLCSSPMPSPGGSPSTSKTNISADGTRSKASGSSPVKGSKAFQGRYVFPYDAEDIKAHKWFRGMPWERLHELEPPLVPHLRSVDDTRYFEEEDEISDWSVSCSSEDSQEDNGPDLHNSPFRVPTPPPGGVPTRPSNHKTAENGNQGVHPEAATDPSISRAEARARQREAEARKALRGLGRSVQLWALTAIATAYDNQRLRQLDQQIDGMTGLLAGDRALLKHFVRAFGRKDRKRARDRLLRDRGTRKVAMEVRKRTAFLGYTWRRMRPAPPPALMDEPWGAAARADSAADGVGEVEEVEGVEFDPVLAGNYLDGMDGVGLDGGDWTAFDGCAEYVEYPRDYLQDWQGDGVMAMRALHRGG